MPDRTPSGIGGNFVLDERIIEGEQPMPSLAARLVSRIALTLFPALPKEVSKIVRVDSHGTSAWNKTARIKTELSDGSGRSFFVKVIHHPQKL